jgi:hypothetical protein
VLVVSVIQRGKEIGILRAMGATQAQMRRIFLLQGGIVGFGSLLGSALAWSFLMLWQLLARNPTVRRCSSSASNLVWSPWRPAAPAWSASLRPAAGPPCGPTRPGGGDPWLNQRESNDRVLHLAGIRKSYGSGEVESEILHGIDLTLRARRVRRPDRPVRLGQEHPAQPDRPARPADQRPSAHRQRG